MTDMRHHNGPPAFDAFSIALDDLRLEAGNFLDGAAIETQGEADRVGQLISTAKKVKKDADAARADEKRPHDEAGKAVQAKWKPLLDRCDTIIAAAGVTLTAYLNKLAAEQRETERKAREDAEKAAQEAREASRQASGNIDAIERAQELEKAAGQAAKIAGRAGKAKAHVSGVDRAIGLRTYKSAEVTDRRALLEWVMRNDPDALAAWLTEYANRSLPAQLPGVTINEDRRVA